MEEHSIDVFASVAGYPVNKCYGVVGSDGILTA